MFSFNSWCFLHVSKIMCSSSGRPFVHVAFYGTFFKHLCQQSSTTFHLHDCLHKCMKKIPHKTSCTNGLPDDEHMMFETCRRHQELNKNINLKIVHFVGLRYIIVSKHVINKMTSLQVLNNIHFPVSDSVHFKYRSYVCIMNLVLTIRGKQKAYRTVVCNSYASACVCCTCESQRRLESTTAKNLM